MKRSALTLSTALLLAAGSARLMAGQTDGRAGRVAASFLTVSPAVRSAALGGDQVAIDGLDSFFSNPAGLETVTSPELWLAHHDSFLQTRYDSAAFAMPAGKLHAGGLLRYVSDGSIDRVGIDGAGDPITGLGHFRPSTLLATGGVSRAWSNRLALGADASAWQESGDAQRTTGWAGDVGLRLSDLAPGLTLGLALRHVGPSEEGAPLPRSLAAGVAFTPRPVLWSHFTFYGEADDGARRGAGLRSGVEARCALLTLRAGYENVSERSGALDGFGFGAGLRIDGWTLDYAWVPDDALGDENRVSVTIRFGLSPEEKQAAARNLDAAMDKRMAQHARQYLDAGRRAEARRDWADAENQFSKALMWDPMLSEATRELDTARANGKAQRAEAEYARGQALAKQGQWLDAAFHWKKAVELDPGHLRAKAALASAEAKTRRSGGSEASEAAYNEGVKRYVSGDYDGALDAWSRVRRDFPEWSSVREYIEKAKNKKLENEIQELKDQQQGPSDVERLSRQAYDAYRDGRIAEATRLWQEVVALDPSNTDAQQALDAARQREALNATGSHADRRVVEMNAQALEAYAGGHLEAAAAIWRKALEIDPMNQRVAANLNRVETEIDRQRHAH